MGSNTSTDVDHHGNTICTTRCSARLNQSTRTYWPNSPQVVAFSRLKIKLLLLFKMNSSEYLNQLLKDKTTISKMPKIFLHLERLLDEGEFTIYKFTVRKSIADLLRFSARCCEHRLFRRTVLKLADCYESGIVRRSLDVHLLFLFGIVYCSFLVDREWSCLQIG